MPTAVVWIQVFANQPPCLCSQPPSSPPKSWNRQRMMISEKGGVPVGSPMHTAGQITMVLGLWGSESSCLPTCLHPLDQLLNAAGTHYLFVFRGFRIVIRFADLALGKRTSTRPTVTNLFCFLHQENSFSLFSTVWQTHLSKLFGPNVLLVWLQPIFSEISLFSEVVLTRPPKPKAWDWFSTDCPMPPESLHSIWPTKLAHGAVLYVNSELGFLTFRDITLSGNCPTLWLFFLKA